MHANAPLTVTGRLILCERIAAGRPIAHIAPEMGISPQTASKWWGRYVELGEAGLVDRCSVPHLCPTRVDQRTERRIIGLRVNRRWGPARIAGHLRLVVSTVWRVLRRWGISRLGDLDPPTGRIIRSYEKQVPGELVHVDVKKFGKIPAGGGWRAHGRGNVKRRKRVGYTFLHSAVDDHTRVAYSEFCEDETAVTSLGFLQRAAQWFADRSINMAAVHPIHPGSFSSTICGGESLVGRGLTENCLNLSRCIEGVRLPRLDARGKDSATDAGCPLPASVRDLAGGDLLPQRPPRVARRCCCLFEREFLVFSLRDGLCELLGMQFCGRSSFGGTIAS